MQRRDLNNLWDEESQNLTTQSLFITRSSPNASPCTSPNRVFYGKSLSTTFSPRSSGIFSQLGNLGSSTSLSSTGSHSVGSSTTQSNIKLKVLTYHDKDYPNDSADASSKPDNTYLHTKMTPDFLDRIRCLSEEHGIFASFRLHKSDANRRYSFRDENGIIADPKQTKTKSKTKINGVCSGHLPREQIFADSPYCYLDNNNSGAFHKSIADSEPDQELLYYLNQHDSRFIKKVVMYKHLICFSEEVPNYTEIDGSYVMGNTSVLKHYFQEYERISSVIYRIIHMTYAFVSLSDRDLIFSDLTNIQCKLDFSPITDIEFKKLMYQANNNFALFSELIHGTKYADFHAAIFYLNHNNVYLPVMTQAGDNGFPICGDADPEHVSYNSYMPSIAAKTFNGRTDSPNKFIIGLKLLYGRLTCATIAKYERYIKKVKEQYPEEFGDYNIFLQNDTNELHYYNYTLSRYYRDVFSNLVLNTLIMYAKSPHLLAGVGNSSIYHLVIQHYFAHPLYLHGTEDLHPGAMPGDFGAILVYFKNVFAITNNERTYLAYLFHDPALLKEQRFGVHPFWIINKASSCTEYWLDLIEIQALHEAAKGIFELEVYQTILYENIARVPKSGPQALTLVKNRLKASFEFLTIVCFDQEAIQLRIDDIYKLHLEDIETIHLILQAHGEPLSLPSPSKLKY